MKLLVLALAIVFALLATLVLGHLALIEIGREVVTLRTPLDNGEWHETRLWVVDYDGAPWVHSGGEAWLARFGGDPVVELQRHGETRRYSAHASVGPHPEIDRLLREKYGIADRWVRFLAPCDEGVVPVRLELQPR